MRELFYDSEQRQMMYSFSHERINESDTEK